MKFSRILLVDDEPQIRRVLRLALLPQGYMVRDAQSGEEALELMREYKPDVVLLDVNMPGMGGLKACRAIRADSEAAIIMITVRNTEQDKIEALDAGADDYVVKPFHTEELLARIRAALRRVPAVPAELIRLGPVEINLNTRRVRKDGQSIRLTPKEHDLLRYFISNPNVPIPREKLLQAVWGPEYAGEAEYLRVFVKQLRKKIEVDSNKPQCILTEPWVGYLFRWPVEAQK